MTLAPHLQGWPLLCGKVSHSCTGELKVPITEQRVHHLQEAVQGVPKLGEGQRW